MKKQFFWLLALISFGACDDGDIVVTTLDFDDVALELCNGSLPNEYVFYKINPETKESVSFNFITDSYAETTVTLTPLLFEISEEANQFIYRNYNTTVTSGNFCNNVPSSNIIITDELVGLSGEAEIYNEILEEDDNDGILAIDEDLNKNGNLEDDDTDGDGIPNYKDQDDDNDNILTSVEIPNEIPDNDNPRDTDGDGIPDYLEEDDDNDGKLTREEDANGNGNPRDDRDPVTGNLFYLDASSTNEIMAINPMLSNTIETTYRTTLSVTNLVFDKNNDKFENQDFILGNRDVKISNTTQLK